MRKWIKWAAAVVVAATMSAARAETTATEKNGRMEVHAELDKARDLARTARAYAIAAAPGHVLARGRAARMEKAAFLGVFTTPVSPAMREQLKLTKGVGLIVESVEKDSPAEQAGIKRYDILEKLNDQWLVNSQQLAVLVRMNKPGDEITVTLIRQGERQTVTAKLVEKELASLDDTNAWGVPGVNIFEAAPFVRDGMINIRGPADIDLGKILKWHGKESVTMIMNDDEHSLTLSIKDGKKTLRATDDAGKVLFDGPIDTDEQRKSIPPEILNKLDKLESQPKAIQMKVNVTTGEKDENAD